MENKMLEVKENGERVKRVGKRVYGVCINKEMNEMKKRVVKEWIEGEKVMIRGSKLEWRELIPVYK